jgi:archaemetzincin
MVNNFFIKVAFILTSIVFFHCNGNVRTEMKTLQKPQSKNLEQISQRIIIQPFKDLPEDELQMVVNGIKKSLPNVTIAKKIPLPALAYYKPRNRYRADSLIHWLNRNTPTGNVTLGLTSKDISSTKGQFDDFGIMGLGYRPGNACIASSYRLSKNNKAEELFKVAIHELGHTQGLPHCSEKYCFMRDAEGGNTTGEEKEFCFFCRKKLEENGWIF